MRFNKIREQASEEYELTEYFDPPSSRFKTFISTKYSNKSPKDAIMVASMEWSTDIVMLDLDGVFLEEKNGKLDLSRLSDKQRKAFEDLEKLFKGYFFVKTANGSHLIGRSKIPSYSFRDFVDNGLMDPYHFFFCWLQDKWLLRVSAHPKLKKADLKVSEKAYGKSYNEVIDASILKVDYEYLVENYGRINFSVLDDPSGE